jgi:SNF2 family DNA or RNA helicase
MSDAIEEIRRIREKQDIKLKPSPYLRDVFMDEYGVERPVVIRNYQKQGIMNLLQSPKHILGDDTGLGKTIELLTTIGYIWMVEPTYIPIVVTNKSSLFQWEAETHKFLQGIETVTVNGDPRKRQELYDDFFNHDSSKKRLLIMTYDMLLRDLKENLIGEKIKGPEIKEAKQKAREFKAKYEESKLKFEEARVRFDIYFENLSYELKESISKLIRGESDNIHEFADKEEIESILNAKNGREAARSEFEKADTLANPVRRVPGILDRIQELKVNNQELKFLVTFDEFHKVKNYKGKIHEIAKELSMECNRVYGMTATPVKNRLMEFFSLFRIIQPTLFPKVTHFMNEYCVTKMQSIGRGRQVPIVVGYKNLDKFVSKIEPYYLSRKKHEVAKELPDLITRELICELTDEQEELYDLAESGVLTQDEDENNAGQVLASLVLCQQAVNSPCLIADADGNPFEGKSSKEEILLELLSDELDEKKVIIFSRFERMVSRIGVLFEEAKIKYVRITGKENDPRVREQAKNTFQNMESGVNVILITTAGSESINLHSAEHMIFFDSPWSWGDYLQIIGRMIRIGSVHTSVVATHLLAQKKDGKKTIDQHVIKALRSKKHLADKVAGDNLPGGLKFTQDMGAMDIFHEIRSGRNAGDKGTLLDKTNKKIQSSKKIHPSKKKPVVEEDKISIISVEI